MTRRPHRRLAPGAILALAAATLLSGCVPFACPAIGWSNSLTVGLIGDTAAVETVQLCVDDVCAPGPAVDPTGPLGTVAVISRDEDEWVFSTDMSTPARLSILVSDADGGLMADAEVAPLWTRVGGSETCGGPHAATVAVEVAPLG